MKKILIAFFIIGFAGSAQAAVIMGQTSGVTKHTVEEFGSGDSLVAQGKVSDTLAVLTDVGTPVTLSSADNTDGLVAGFIHDYVFTAIQNTFVSIASATQLSGSQAGTFITPLTLQLFHLDGVDTLLASAAIADDGNGVTRSALIDAELIAGQSYVIRMTNEGGTDLGSDPNYTVKVNSAVPVPAAIWLFGTALIGLVGFGRKSKKVAAA